MLFWLACAFTGLSLWCVLWLLTQPLRGEEVGLAPQATALIVRCVWPWVHTAAVLCQPFLSWPLRSALVQRIRSGGLSSQWLPEHIVALQLLSAGSVAGLALILFLVQWKAPLSASLLWALAGGVGGACWPRHWLNQLGKQRQHLMLREFPFLLDITTLCVEAGMNLHGALQQAARYGPKGHLRTELQHALADMRAGVGRQQALQQMAERTRLPAVQQWVTALAQADQLGMSLGPLLRAQSELRRNERFLRAEKLALEAPVKMLFPMVFCIFPCTFLIIGFPVAVKLMEAAW